jgi:hypothetical protein
MLLFESGFIVHLVSHHRQGGKWRAPKPTRDKGSFELRFVKNGIAELISPSSDYLRELFK